MADLHAQLLAEIERREAIVQAASDGPWQVSADPADPDSGEAVRDQMLDVIAYAYTPADDKHIALHDPADALRRYAHYRRILERHAPSDTENVWEHGESHPACTHGYDDPDDNAEALQWRNCPEIRDLAEALRVPTQPDPGAGT